MKAQRQTTKEVDQAQTLASTISRYAELRPTSEAFVGQSFEAITYAQLSEFVSSVSEQLARLGVGHGARVGLSVPPGPFGAALVVGIAAHATLVPLNPALSAAELANEFRSTGMSFLIAPEDRKSEFGWLTENDPFLISASRTAGFEAKLQAVSGRPIQTAPAECVTDASTALLLRSSGTTGAPKLIEVTHQNLISMSGKMADWFSLSHTDRVACTLPLFYAAGLKTTLFVPLLLGATIGFPSPKSVFNIAEWIDVIRPTYLSVAPTPLRAMLDRLRGADASRDLSFLRFAICGAAYLPDALRDETEQLLGVPVLEYYGLSEAGAMAANPAPPRLRKPGTVGLFPRKELALVDEAGHPVPAGTIGSICISGPSVTPSRAGMELVGTGAYADWLLTGDLGSIDDDGYLTIVGRTKDIINRGGEKVSPYEVEKVLLSHPDVEDAGVFGTAHPRLGENVAAAVVLKPNGLASPLELKAFAADRLTPFKVPSAIHIVDKLPRGVTGKLLRNVLEELTSASATRDMAEPDRMLEHQILEIWQRLLQRRDIGIDDDFFVLGGDSLLAARMLEEIEALFKREISQRKLSPALTIRSLTDAICSDLGPSKELLTQAQTGKGAPFFFCHGDYVSRGLYANRLLSQLGTDQPIYLLHFYQSMHRPDLTIEEIARLYLHEIMKVQPDGPVVLGGYCNGALVAWEVAHLLEGKGRKVEHLLMIEAPSLNARPSFRTLHRICMTAAALLPPSLGMTVKLKGMRALWHHLRGSRGYSSGPPQPKAAFSHLQRKQKGAATHEPPSPHWLYLRTMARFLPKRLKADVTCFIALDGNRRDTDPAQWRRLTRSVDVVELPGTHHTMVTSEATMLGVAMRRAMSRR